MFDPEHPPDAPPAGADPLVWRLAQALHTDHRPAADTSCVVCRRRWPCGPRQLAERGLLLAFHPGELRKAGSPPTPGRW